MVFLVIIVRRLSIAKDLSDLRGLKNWTQVGGDHVLNTGITRSHNVALIDTIVDSDLVAEQKSSPIFDLR